MEAMSISHSITVQCEKNLIKFTMVNCKYTTRIWLNLSYSKTYFFDAKKCWCHVNLIFLVWCPQLITTAQKLILYSFKSIVWRVNYPANVEVRVGTWKNLPDCLSRKTDSEDRIMLYFLDRLWFLQWTTRCGEPAWSGTWRPFPRLTITSRSEAPDPGETSYRRSPTRR